MALEILAGALFLTLVASSTLNLKLGGKRRLGSDRLIGFRRGVILTTG